MGFPRGSGTGITGAVCAALVAAPLLALLASWAAESGGSAGATVAASSLGAGLPEEFRELGPWDRPAIPELGSMRCFETEHGLIFCASEDGAKQLADQVRHAARAYAAAYGFPPAKGALVDGVAEAPEGKLRTQGAKWVLTLNAQGRLDFSPGRLRRLLGALWFRREFDYRPRIAADGTPAAGRPIPAWLAATAGAITEGGGTAEGLWQILSARFAGDEGGSPEPAPFLAADAQVPSCAEELWLPGTSFAAYALERTGEPKVFRLITSAWLKGASFNQWLAEHGSEIGLLSDPADLAGDWRAWEIAKRKLAQRLRGPRPAASRDDARTKTLVRVPVPAQASPERRQVSGPAEIPADL